MFSNLIDTAENKIIQILWHRNKFKRALTFRSVVDHIWVVFFGQNVEFEDARINKIMPDEETVLFAFEPTVSTRESYGPRLFTYLVIDMVYITHVPLQLN